MGNARVALVTGSTSGIGRAIAERLAEGGFSVMLNGMGDRKEIDKYAGELAIKFGVNVNYHPADLRYPEQVAEMVEATEKQLGSVDVLVNNAGIQHVSPIESFPVDKYNDIISINLSSAWHATRAAVPGMKSRGWGRIINVASVHGLVGSPNKTAYCIAKFGIVGFTKSVCLELAEHKITVNAICPGWVLTPLVQKQIEELAAKQNISLEEASAKMLELKHPSKKFVEAQRIADLAHFLSTDSAADMTGNAIEIDGGWTAQ